MTLTKAQRDELTASAHECGLLGCGWQHRQAVARECRSLGYLTAAGHITDAGRAALKGGAS